jgi:hypothetical protein
MKKRKKEGRQQQKTYFFLDNYQKVNPSAKVFWQRQLDSLLSRSSKALLFDSVASAQSCVKYRIYYFSFLKSTPRLLKHEISFCHHR